MADMAKHHHKYKLQKSWHRPHGYLFKCMRCVAAGRYPFKFIRREQFWGKS